MQTYANFSLNNHSYTPSHPYLPSRGSLHGLGSAWNNSAYALNTFVFNKSFFENQKFEKSNSIELLRRVKREAEPCTFSCNRNGILGIVNTLYETVEQLFIQTVDKAHEKKCQYMFYFKKFTHSEDLMILEKFENLLKKRFNFLATVDVEGSHGCFFRRFFSCK